MFAETEKLPRRITQLSRRLLGQETEFDIVPALLSTEAPSFPYYKSLFRGEREPAAPTNFCFFGGKPFRIFRFLHCFSSLKKLTKGCSGVTPTYPCSERARAMRMCGDVAVAMRERGALLVFQAPHSLPCLSLLQVLSKTIMCIASIQDKLDSRLR